MIDALVILISFFTATVDTSLTPSQAVAAARRIHPAPDGNWEVVDQAFWKNHVVVRLTGTSSVGWYHRPSIAVDQESQAIVLTDGVVRLPRSKLIESFNQIAGSEGMALDNSNFPSYAGFFLMVHLRNHEADCIVFPGAAAGACSETGFRWCEGDGEFWVETDLVNLKSGARRQLQFRIRPDGTVVSQNAKTTAACP